MEIIVYIQNNIFEADLAIAYTLFSRIPHTNVKVVGLTKGDYYSFSGVGINVIHGIDDVKHADLLIVLGNERQIVKEDANLNQWITRMAMSAKCVVGLSSGSVQLFHADITKDVSITYPVHYNRAFKKLSQKAVFSRCVISSKFITTSVPSATYGALLLAAKSVYGSSTAACVTLGEKEIDFDALIAMDKSRYKGYKKTYVKYLKLCNQVNKMADKQAVFYLFEDISALDVLMTTAALSHLPYKMNFIANSAGKIFVEGGGFKIIADKAIQNFYQSDLLIIGGGSSIKQSLVSEYLTHWVTKIAPASFRVLTIAEGEQILGVSGVLRDVNMDVLNNLPLGEGKYLMVGDAFKAQQSIFYVGKKDHKIKAKELDIYFGIH